MDTNMIILILAGLVAFGLIYRSVSSKPEKTTGGGTSPTTPTQPDQSELMVFEQIEKKFSVKIDRAEVDVYASSAVSEIAKRLKLKVGDPCLGITRRYYELNNLLFEVTVTHHPESRYTYSMEFTGTPTR